MEGLRTTRVRVGEYYITRIDDGRRFVALKSEMTKRWIVEAQDTLSVDDYSSLRTAQYAIRDRWSPMMRETAYP